MLLLLVVTACLLWLLPAAEQASAMSGGDVCSNCHTTTVQNHRDIRCEVCHTDGSVGEGYIAFSAIPDNAEWHRDCAFCHEPTYYPQVPQHVPAAVDVAHQTTTTGCDQCHATGLVTEHEKNPLFTCSTCHNSANAAVQAAITAGDTSCGACHDIGAGHGPLHDNGTTDPTCLGCHEGNTSAAHSDNCAQCHSSTDPVVVNAISTHNVACSACHDVGAGHGPLHDNGTTDPTCLGCHAGNTSAAHADNCALCHSSTDPTVQAAIAANDITCSACHGVAAGNHQPLHDNGTADPTCLGCHAGNTAAAHSDNCALCHSSTDPIVVAAIAANNVTCGACHGTATDHGPLHDNGTTDPTCLDCHAGNTSAAHSANCALCHSSTNPTVVAAIAANNVTCVACHEGAGHVAQHVSTSDSSCFTSACHSTTKNLMIVHEPYVGPGSTHPEYDRSCDLCHDNPAVDPSTSGTGCIGACHTTSHQEQHELSEGGCITPGCHAANAMTIHAGGPACTACHDDGVTPSFVCSSCHSGDPHAGVSHATNVTCNACHGVQDLVIVHGRDCAKCHPLASEVSPWNGTCQQAGCHGTLHTGVPYDHMRQEMEQYYGEDCFGCHGEPTPAAPGDCRACHYLPDATAPVTTSNARPSYAGGASLTLSATDSGSGVRSTFYRLDGGAVTVGTSIDLGAPAGAGPETHTLEFWSQDNAFNSETPKSVTFEVWPSDTTAPTTTSNTQSTYLGSAAINLTAADAGGAGVAATYYSLDGGAQQMGTSVTVATSGPHVLEFWSVDHSGNVEAPRKSASFNINAGTGTITMAWNNPPEGSWARATVYDAQGRVVYQASSPAWSPAGWFTISVPVSSQPYSVRVRWYDSEYDDEGSSLGTALVNSPGKTVTFWY
ncbi:MAG: hypothetical protein HY876_09905 [Coriobacteriales bacterium]|nr:hypothetical protein [Coriobacteriales bacterium]